MITQFILLVFSALLLVAAWKDVTEYKIPNIIPAALVLIWPVAAFFLGLGWMDIVLSVAVSIGVLGICMALWAPGLIGGGDGKLLAATSLWFAWPDVQSFLLYALLAGGVLSLGLLIIRKLVPAMGMAGKALQGTALEEGGASPYGIAITAGALLALPSSHLLMTTAS